MVTKARTGADEDFEVWSKKTGIENDLPSLTVQADMESADLNVILDRFGITGQMPQSLRLPTYEDYSATEVFDFRSAVEAIDAAEDAFMCMPAKVRAEFANDPQVFLEFCSNPENLPRMRELGLAKPEVKPEPEKIQKVEVVNPAKPG